MSTLLAALALAGAAQAYVVPPPGSEARKQVLGALRPAVEKRLGPDIEFKVTEIRVQRDWAFVVAGPQRRGGKPIDGWRIFGEHFGNMDGLRVEAVLRKRAGAGRWSTTASARLTSGIATLAPGR